MTLNQPRTPGAIASYVFTQKPEHRYSGISTMALKELKAEQFFNQVFGNKDNFGSRFYVFEDVADQLDSGSDFLQKIKMMMNKNDENVHPQKIDTEKKVSFLEPSKQQVPIYNSVVCSGNYIHLLLKAANYLENVSFDSKESKGSNIGEYNLFESSFAVTSSVKSSPFSSGNSPHNAAIDRDYTCDNTGVLKIIHLKCLLKDCNTTLLTKSELNKHLMDVHQMGAYRCVIHDCLQKTVSFTKKYTSSSAVLHPHHLIIVPVFSPFPHRSDYTAHLELEHSGKGGGGSWADIICGQCYKYFKNAAEVAKHYFQEHELGHFLCGEGCGFEPFLNRAQVLKHRRQAHTGLKCRLPCSQCSKTFNKLPDLKRHLDFHDGVKPYICVHCGGAFTLKSDLKKHERIHTGERPFYCLWVGCTYQATDRSSVSGHVRTRHFGIPRNKAEQMRRGIVDNRETKNYIGIKK
ncbi:hypothetical protein TYRP_023176 [Tyrophagus putrescentiae]|nr:hypothetical protein TYRP_023176 [Tyrophagus putrescentiae]